MGHGGADPAARGMTVCLFAAPPVYLLTYRLDCIAAFKCYLFFSLTVNLCRIDWSTQGMYDVCSCFHKHRPVV